MSANFEAAIVVTSANTNSVAAVLRHCRAQVHALTERHVNKEEFDHAVEAILRDGENRLSNMDLYCKLGIRYCKLGTNSEFLPYVVAYKPAESANTDSRLSNILFVMSKELMGLK
jgi:hypothetical protein